MLVEDTEIQRARRFRRIDVPARLRRQAYRVPPVQRGVQVVPGLRIILRSDQGLRQLWGLVGS
jgi:hypothetical protein